jgi:hypothetical protein
VADCLQVLLSVDISFPQGFLGTVFSDGPLKGCKEQKNFLSSSKNSFVRFSEHFKDSSQRFVNLTP